MKESSTYQAILREGMAEGMARGRTEGRVEGRTEGSVEEARKLLLLLGAKRWGAPDARSRAAIEAITDLARLEQLTERLLDVSGWDELLALR